MKISFLTRSIGISGGMRVVLKLSDLLVGRGHEVEVTVMEGMGVSAKDYVPSRPLWQPTRATIRFVPTLDEEHLGSSDATIATSWLTAAALNIAKSKKGTRVYLVQHYESLYHGPPRVVDETYRLGFLTFVVSHWLQMLLLEKFRVNSELFIIPVDRTVFTPASLVRSSTFRVCLFYSPLPWKGFEIGLEAVRRVRVTGRRVDLVVISALPAAITEADCEMHIGKSQVDLAQVYRSCDIFLCTSLVEGLGLPGMEAMACGCALITTDTKGSRSYAEHEKTALVVNPRSADGLANAIIRLFENREELRQLQLSGLEKISTFSWDEAAKSFETVVFGKKEFVKVKAAKRSKKINEPRCQA